MNKPTRSSQTIKAAADAVVEYTLISFEPRFLLWEKLVNLGVAERVWNAHALGADRGTAGVPSEAELAEPEFAELMRTLARARKRWARETFLVLGLDIHHRGGEVLITFDLTWDEGETFQPCEIAVDFCLVGPAGASRAASPNLN